TIPSGKVGGGSCNVQNLIPIGEIPFNFLPREKDAIGVGAQASNSDVIGHALDINDLAGLCAVSPTDDFETNAFLIVHSHKFTFENTKAPRRISGPRGLRLDAGGLTESKLLFGDQVKETHRPMRGRYTKERLIAGLCSKLG